jgi:hypothetical protein
MNARPEEFSLSIRYRTPGNGSYPRVDVPGFYLTAGTANEGEADWSYDQRLVDPEGLMSIARSIDIAMARGVELNELVSGRNDGPLARQLRPLSNAGEEQLLRTRAALETEIVRKTEQLERVRAALAGRNA